MARWILLRALLAAGLCGCAPRVASSPPPRPAPSNADLDAWQDAADGAGPARSTTLRALAPSLREGPRTIAFAAPAPSRPLRRAPVDVSFQKADLVTAFQLLADAGRFNLVMSEGLTGQVSATLRGIDPYDALKAMAEANGVEVRYDGQVVVLRKR